MESFNFSRPHRREVHEVIIYEEIYIFVNGSHYHPYRPILKIGTIVNNQTIIPMANLQVKAGGFAPLLFALLDPATGNVIAATFSNASATSDNQNAVTVTGDAGSPQLTGVAEGTANVAVSVHASYTDPNTNEVKEADFTATVAVDTVAGNTNPGGPQPVQPVLQVSLGDWQQNAQ